MPRRRSFLKFHGKKVASCSIRIQHLNNRLITTFRTNFFNLYRIVLLDFSWTTSTRWNCSFNDGNTATKLEDCRDRHFQKIDLKICKYKKKIVEKKEIILWFVWHRSCKTACWGIWTVYYAHECSQNFNPFCHGFLCTVA
jgi:hypothetical protein